MDFCVGGVILLLFEWLGGQTGGKKLQVQCLQVRGFLNK